MTYYHIRHLSKQLIGTDCITRETYAVIRTEGADSEQIDTHHTRAAAVHHCATLNVGTIVLLEDAEPVQETTT